MNTVEKVLVIGDDTRSFLATVRSLGRQGLQVHVAPYNLLSPSLASRYIAQVHLLPYYLDGGAAWLEAMLRLLQTERFSLVIPCDERTLLPLFMHRALLEPHAVLSIPDARGLELFFDKHQTRHTAAALDVPVARGRLLTDADTAETVLADIGLPLVIKYRKSFSWPDVYVRTGVQTIQTSAELSQWLARHPQRGDRLLVEQIFEGFGIGVSVLCDRGRVLQAFEHHRAREMKGSSFYRKSAPVDPARLDAVARLAAHAGFTGIAMFEFKVNAASGEWILLEVNARPWGSLPLPVALGVDFPYRLYQLLVRRQPTPPVAYRADVYGRNLLPDLWQAASVAKSLVRRPGKLGAHLLGWLWEFRRVASGREHQDVWVRDDPRPGLRELKDYAASLGRSARARLLGPAPLRTGLREKLRSLCKPGGANLDVLFVCQGNICRSPYAEVRLQQLLKARGLACKVHSAGLLPRNQRPSPETAIQAAARRGVDLRAHRSRHAGDDITAGASLVLLFDRINLKSLQARYPHLAEKSYFLGELLGTQEPACELHDPDNQGEAKFDAVYAQIDQCLEQFVAVMAEPVEQYAVA